MNARTPFGRLLALVLSLLVSQLAVPAAQAASAAHVVDPSLVAARLAEQTALRQQRITDLQAFLDGPAAREQARAAGVDVDRVRSAVPHLSDAELADLNQRAAQARDVVAGHRGGGDAGWIVLGVVLLVAGLAILAAAEYDDWDDDYYDDCWCY